MQEISERLPKSRRLLTKFSYNRVFYRPSKSIDDFFTVLWRPNQLENGRLGMAISKRVLKRAVDRNRVKRLVRESFRHHQHCLSGIDIVVLARHRLPLDDNKIIADSLQRHWIRISKRLDRTCLAFIGASS